MSNVSSLPDFNVFSTSLSMVLKSLNPEESSGFSIRGNPSELIEFAGLLRTLFSAGGKEQRQGERIAVTVLIHSQDRNFRHCISTGARLMKPDRR